MKAVVGDRIVVVSAKVDRPVRDGEIIETGADGAPPYTVRWSDTDRETLFYPGSDAHVEHQASPAEQPEAEPQSRPGYSHTRTWRIDVYVHEGEDRTTANAVLHTDAANPLTSSGEAHLRPGDPNVPEIGDEVAAARALRRLADHLLAAANEDLSSLEGRPINVQP